MNKLMQFGTRICTASVVIREMRFDVERLPDDKHKMALTNYLNRLLAQPIAVLPYDNESALYQADERVRPAALGYNTPYADSRDCLRQWTDLGDQKFSRLQVFQAIAIGKLVFNLTSL